MEQLTLQCTAAPVDLYLSQEATVCLNEFRLTLISHIVSSPLPLPPVSTVDGTPAITLSCDWDNPVTALCTREEAEVALVECDGWTILWKGSGWLLKPPESLDLSKGFAATFLFSDLISNTQEGTAVLKICLFGFPAFAPCASFIATMEKRYPLKIVLFKAEPEKPELGESVTLSWSVANCRDCFLCGQQVKPLDSKEFCLTGEGRSFFLTAYNEFARSASAELTVTPTHWLELGTVTAEMLPLGKEKSLCNGKLHAHDGRFYLLADAKLYQADTPEALTWSVCADVPIGAEMLSFFDAAVLRDELVVVGETTALQYSFAQKKWSSSAVELRTGCHAACRVCSMQNELVHGAVLDKTKLLFSRRGAGTNRWERNWFLDVKNSITQIGAFDMTEFHGTLYAAVQDVQKKQIFIYSTDDLDDWRLWGRQSVGGEWFYLLHTNERLFLLTSEKLIDLNGGTASRDFPTFPAMSRLPFACSGEDRFYLAAPGAAGSCFYRFKA